MPFCLLDTHYNHLVVAVTGDLAFAPGPSPHRAA